MKWITSGYSAKASSRGSIDIGAYIAPVRESADGRFQAQRCQEFDGYRNGRRVFYRWWKLFDGVNLVAEGSWRDIASRAESLSKPQKDST